MTNLEYVNVKTTATKYFEYYKYLSTEIKLENICAMNQLNIYDFLVADLEKEFKVIESKMKFYGRIAKTKKEDLLTLHESRTVISESERYYNLTFVDFMNMIKERKIPYYDIGVQKVVVKKELMEWIYVNNNN